MTIRVLLADDHAVVRAGLHALLDAGGDLEVVGEVADGRAAVRLAAELQPDVVVIDVAMPGLNGIDATAAIREATPRTRVVVLSMHGTKEHVFRALRAGATGYVLKESAGRLTVDAVRAVHRGALYLCPQLRELADPWTHRPGAEARSPLEALSAREREVLQLVAEGFSSATIAERLCLSPKTVETYRARLMRKLGVGSVAELVKFAVAHGLTPPS